MAKKTPTAKVKQTSKSRSAAKSAEEKRPQSQEKEGAEPGALQENYRGERNREEHRGSPGSIEDETLDQSAPYNKTYGRQRSAGQ